MPNRAASQYRDRLLAKERELLSGILRVQSDGRDATPAGAQDMADQADECYNKESLFQQSSSARDLLVLVQAALRRAEAGDFGLCVECGEPLNKKRLDALPWAHLCVTCQQREEKELL
jgi:DnaK suppressor protein